MFGNTLVTGGAGFLGSALVRRLEQENLCDKIIICRSNSCDLRSQVAVANLFDDFGPFDTIFHLAATVSGIGHISKNPAIYFYDNIQMGINLIHAAHLHRARKIIVAGSVCAYPLKAPIPMHESDLWNGEPEPTNGSYGIAKRTLQTMLKAYYEQYSLRSAYLLLANLYGPGDDFSIQTSHVIPSLIRKMISDPNNLKVWGSGHASRDFLYVEDAVSALIESAKNISVPLPMNIASGKEITIREVVSILADLLSYSGKIDYDISQPDGQPRRLFSLERAKHLIPNWSPKTDLVEGLTQTIEWYKNV